jgi:hypothetical protein
MPFFKQKVFFFKKYPAPKPQMSYGSSEMASKVIPDTA